MQVPFLEDYSHLVRLRDTSLCHCEYQLSHYLTIPVPQRLAAATSLTSCFAGEQRIIILLAGDHSHYFKHIAEAEADSPYTLIDCAKPQI